MIYKLPFRLSLTTHFVKELFQYFIIFQLHEMVKMGQGTDDSILDTFWILGGGQRSLAKT